MPGWRILRDTYNSKFRIRHCSFTTKVPIKGKFVNALHNPNAYISFPQTPRNTLSDTKANPEPTTSVNAFPAPKMSSECQPSESYEIERNMVSGYVTVHLPIRCSQPVWLWYNVQNIYFKFLFASGSYANFYRRSTIKRSFYHSFKSGSSQ